MKEIKRAVKLMQANGLNKKKLTILHCNSSYPTSPNQLNLNVIGYLKNKFKVDTGLSDHSNSIVAPLAAVAMGAKVIEKTLYTQQESRRSGPRCKFESEGSKENGSRNSLR